MLYVTDMRAILTNYSMAGRDSQGNALTNTPVFATFSFEEDVSALSLASFGQAFADSFQPLSSEQRALAREAFELWDAASGVTFLEAPSGMGSIKLAVFDFDAGGPYSSAEAAAYAGGDRFYISDKTGTGSLGLYLHEIGHNLGFKHTFTGEFVLAPEDDNYSNSVMSYTRDRPREQLGVLDHEAVTYRYGAPGTDGTQVAAWSWNAATYTLSQTGFEVGETITGTDANDVIDARAGDDIINAGAGHDQIDGGDGNDTITWTARTQPALIQGGAGDDEISVILDGDAHFQVDGGEGVDIARLRLGVDHPHIISVADLIAEGARFVGIEELAIDSSRDRPATIVGSTLDETIWGSAGDDVLDGGAGDDFLFGSGGVDRLFGGEGDDRLTIDVAGEWGARVLDGGAGEDSATVRFNDATGRSFDVAVLLGIESAQVFANSGDDTLRAGSSRSTLRGNDGDDILIAGSAFDFLYGGNGADRFVFEGATDSTSGVQDQIEDFVSGTDLIDLSGFNSTEVSITAFGGSTWIKLDMPDKTEFRVFVRSTVAEGDLLRGFEGTSAGETITGSAGADILRAMGGDDTILGGRGDDRIDGGAGTDTAIMEYDYLRSRVSLVDGAVVVDAPGGERDELVNVEVIRFADRVLEFGTLSASLKVDFIMLAESGWAGSIGGTGTVFGTTGFQDITLLGDSAIDLDASFNRGGDRINLPGEAATYRGSLAGSELTIESTAWDSSVTIPVGIERLAVNFADGVREVTYDPVEQAVKVGSQTMPADAITATPVPGSSGQIDASVFARLILYEDADLALAGHYQMFGSQTADWIEIGGGGHYEFDASFNSGLDTIEVGRAAGDFSARMDGSKVVLSADDRVLSIPVGSAGLSLDFGGDERTLRFDADTATVWLGSDMIGPDGTQLEAALLSSPVL